MAILVRCVDAVYRTLRQARTFKSRGVVARPICFVLSGIWITLVAQAAMAERLLSILPQCAGTGEIVTLTFDTLAQDLPEIRINGTIAPFLSSAEPIIRVTVPLTDLPFPVTEELDAGAVHEQVQGTFGAAVRDLNRRGLLPAAQGAEVWDGPVQPRQPEQAGHHTRGLSQRELEQHFDRKTELNGGIREDGWATGATFMRRQPSHVLVHPGQHRAAPAQRRVVAGPIRRAVAGGRWLAHTPHLTAWIRAVNHQKSEFCNNAGPMCKMIDRTEERFHHT